MIGERSSVLRREVTADYVNVSRAVWILLRYFFIDREQEVSGVAANQLQMLLVITIPNLRCRCHT